MKENIANKNEITVKLQEGLKDIIESGRYAEFLRFTMTINNYTLRNLILLFSQDSNATMINSFKNWKELGRYVRKGEKALRVMAPKLKTITEEENDEKTGKTIEVKNRLSQALFLFPCLMLLKPKANLCQSLHRSLQVILSFIRS